MDAKLTYCLILSFVGWLAASCSSDAPDNVDVSKGSEMSFAVAEMSRASVTTSFNRFALYGDMKFPVENDAAATGVFDKTEVTYVGGNWVYEGTRYWMPGHEHSFIAVSPVSVLETGNPTYSNSQLSFTYTIPAAGGTVNKDDVTDILAATHRRLYDDADANTTATFRFGHILSLINLAPALADNIMGPDAYIAIRRLELSGFSTGARIDILPAARQSNRQTDDRVIDIAGHQSEAALAVDFAEPVKIANDRKNVNLFADGDAIIMLPQTFAADSEAKIVLTYTVNDDPSERQVTLPLMSQKWESGKSYAYRFTLDRTGLIVNTVSITDWDRLDGGNIDAH